MYSHSKKDTFGFYFNDSRQIRRIFKNTIQDLLQESYNNIKIVI